MRKMSCLNGHVICAVILGIILILNKKMLGMSSTSIYISMCVLLCLSFNKNRFFVVYSFIVSLLFIIDVHLVRMYNASLNKIGMQIFESVSASDGQEIKSYIKEIIWQEKAVVLICCVIFVFFIIKFKEKYSFKRFLSYAIVTILGVFYGTPNYIIAYIYKYTPHVGEKEIMIERDNFKFEPQKPKNQIKNVVLLRGESHRHDYFSKSFEEYKDQFKDLIYFDDMISQYHYTFGAFPMILSRKKLENKSYYFKESSILKLFGEARYERRSFLF